MTPREEKSVPAILKGILIASGITSNIWTNEVNVSPATNSNVPIEKNSSQKINDIFT